MPRYITSIKFTNQGSVEIRDTVKRAKAFKSTAKKHGANVREIYWTLGTHDGLIVFDAPDDETATALMLGLSSQGNVQTQTGRAYDATEVEQILSKLG